MTTLATTSQTPIRTRHPAPGRVTMAGITASEWIKFRTLRSTALSSASANRRFAPLPPSSSVTRFSVSAAAFEIARPARVDPVKALQKGRIQVLSEGENRLRRYAAIATLAALSVPFLAPKNPVDWLKWSR